MLKSCNKNNQPCFLSFINICKVSREVLKTLGFVLGSQHFLRDLTNIYEWKIIFDPSGWLLGWCLGAGLDVSFVSMSGRSLTKWWPSRHDHSCLLGNSATIKQNKVCLSVSVAYLRLAFCDK